MQLNMKVASIAVFEIQAGTDQNLFVKKYKFY